ncbi:DNA (cytosine-5-)-methyltransferase [Providencia huaxiensis]|uniref:DNA (cytosine-5-)-methyltransferase n=1 Tax=Providencia huaxiensis TaxID=2027290 RepID=UPI0034DD3F40
MIYLSLFNGISAGRLALSRAGIEFDKYYIAEIDKFANKVSDFHYPDNIQLGDVNNWRDWDIDWSNVGLVTAGFPCQSWSLAGKQKGDKDERGKLFWVTLDIMSHVLENNPSAKFMLENVKMKKEFEEYITLHTEKALGTVHKTLINSALVSAQNRNRFYWANFPVSQPEDKGILLKDIIDDDSVTDRDKSRRQIVFGGAIRGRYIVDGIRQDHKMKTAGMTTQRLEAREDGKTNTLTTVQKDNVVVIYQRPRGKNKGAEFTEKSPTLTACSWEENNKLSYRKLTPTECARLQTFPDGWCENVVSNSQSYKAYGNAWTVDVIKHIFECMERSNNARRDRNNVRFDNDVIRQSSAAI